MAPIASGGMATVYLARVTGAGGFARQVAVKLLDARAPDQHAEPVSESLLAEARLAAQVRHPAVVPVLDAGESTHGPFLVMEFVEGDSLANLHHAVQQVGDRLPPAIALRILSDALEGLHAAHEARDEVGKPLGIVHRDFSPQNILVGVDGQSRLTDFGIARSVDRAEYTRTGIVRGKIGYMSPEQAEGATLDRTCDVWAAGVVAWELFAGRRLFSGDPVPTLLRILNSTPPSLSSSLPGAPIALSDAIAAALVKDASLRCSSAGELRRRLLAACRGWVEPAATEEVAELVRSLVGPKLRALRERAAARRNPEPPEAKATPSRKIRIGWWATGATLLAAVGLAPFAAPKQREEPPARAATPSPASAPSQAPAAHEITTSPPPATGDRMPQQPPEVAPKPKAARVTQAAGTRPTPRKEGDRSPSDLAPNPY